MFFYLLNKFDTLILILLIITGVLVILAFIAFDRKRRYTDVKDMKKELLLLIGSSALAMIFAFLLAVDFYHMNEISSQVEDARNNLVTNSVISEKKNEIKSDQPINTNPSTHRITMPDNRGGYTTLKKLKCLELFSRLLIMKSGTLHSKFALNIADSCLINTACVILLTQKNQNGLLQ